MAAESQSDYEDGPEATTISFYVRSMHPKLAKKMGDLFFNDLTLLYEKNTPKTRKIMIEAQLHSVSFKIWASLQSLGFDTRAPCSFGIPREVRDRYSLYPLEIDPKAPLELQNQFRQAYREMAYCTRVSKNIFECDLLVVFNPNHNKDLNCAINYSHCGEWEDPGNLHNINADDDFYFVSTLKYHRIQRTMVIINRNKKIMRRLTKILMAPCYHYNTVFFLFDDGFTESDYTRFVEPVLKRIKPN